LAVSEGDFPSAGGSLRAGRTRARARGASHAGDRERADTVGSSRGSVLDTWRIPDAATAVDEKDLLAILGNTCPVNHSTQKGK
jgi:hypothetical protein